MEKVPYELDWVKKRAACSLKQVFSELHRGVIEDVKDANDISPLSTRRTPFEVTVGRAGEDFTVQRGESVRPVVTFLILGDHISISTNASSEKWEFTVGLNDEGRCLLRQNGQEYEQWQVRKMALEGLFFNS
jgi:hypothetical protein